MRSAAERTIHDYAMRPVQSDIYQADILDKGGAMLKALREWEKRRGIVHSFRNRFMPPRPPREKPQQTAKPKVKKDRPIKVPREPKSPGRKKQFTSEERRLRKNECNKRYRAQNREAAKQRSREWRAKLTPEQKQIVRDRINAWRKGRRAQKKLELAAHNAGDGQG